MPARLSQEFKLPSLGEDPTDLSWRAAAARTGEVPSIFCSVPSGLSIASSSTFTVAVEPAPAASRRGVSPVLFLWVRDAPLSMSSLVIYGGVVRWWGGSTGGLVEWAKPSQWLARWRKIRFGIMI